MIRGRFGAGGRPFVWATVRLDRQRVALSIAFLVDSGADSSSLSPRDWLAAGLRRDDFAPASVSVTGYGGTIDCAVERAELVFNADDGTFDRWTTDLEIAPATGTAMIIPSILGRMSFDVTGSRSLRAKTC